MSRLRAPRNTAIRPHRQLIRGSLTPNQKPDVHYVTRQDIFKHLWSGEKLEEEADIDYLYEKHQSLNELKLYINHFREIFIYKNSKLLDWFIAIYSQSSIKPVASCKRFIIPDISWGFVARVRNGCGYKALAVRATKAY